MIRTSDQIHTNEADHLSIGLSINPDLCYFEGHFPDAPVLPGVVLVGWVMDYAQEYFNPDYYLSSTRQLKFHHGVKPGQQLTLDISRRGALLEFSYTDEENMICASGIIRTGTADV
jgi:3-hydroxymyristoyl/3-hydroxydecanoyl-(acyl carrier protein) dehydratase